MTDKKLEYTVTKTQGEFCVQTPYRHCLYVAPTEKEAVEYALYGLAELARKGVFNPNNPSAIGCTPVQHAIDVLLETIEWYRERRQEVTTKASQCLETTWPQGSDKDLLRYNEAISGLSTAVAALARVKAL